MDFPKLLSDIAYLVSAILFIVGLKFLSNPKKARNGNQLAAIGMTFAVVASLVFIFGGGLNGARTAEGLPPLADTHGLLIIIIHFRDFFSMPYHLAVRKSNHTL